MVRFNHPVERLVEIINFNNVEFEVVERPDVLWVGSVDYANNNTDESDWKVTLERFQDIIKDITDETDTRNLICPDWSAAVSINYSRNDKPSGLLYGNETYSDKQDKRFDLFTQPGGLWLRVLKDENAVALLEKEKADNFTSSQILQRVAEENGYMENPDINISVEYNCHAEYNNPPHRNYAYIPIIKKSK